MAYSEEIKYYKQKITSLIINNSDIVDLFDEPTIIDPEKLIYNNVFNFIRIPKTPEETKSYVCFKIDIPEVCPSNFLYKTIVITFWVITHQDNMITDLGGTKIDLMAIEIEKIFNGYKGFGNKPLELISNIEGVASNIHPCRIITFRAEDVNISRCSK